MSDNHGNTPAAWTGVSFGMAAFVVGAAGLMLGSLPMFWVGVALMPIGVIVGYIMARMGYGHEKWRSKNLTRS